MHASVSCTTQKSISKTSELANEIQNLHSKRLADGTEEIVKILEPIVQETFKRASDIQCICIKNLTDKILSKEKQRRTIQVFRESSDIIYNNYITIGMKFTHFYHQVIIQ